MHAAGLLVFGLAAGVAYPAHAQLAPISDEEFRSQVAGRTIHISHVDGKQKYIVELQESGKAVVSSSFNDVGRWRSSNAGGYCVVWNKLAPTERCTQFARRDGTLVTLDVATGQANSTVEIR